LLFLSHHFTFAKKYPLSSNHKNLEHQWTKEYNLILKFILPTVEA
jgi:hypothetical protein